jgi:hypothetical protein
VFFSYDVGLNMSVELLSLSSLMILKILLSVIVASEMLHYWIAVLWRR